MKIKNIEVDFNFLDADDMERFEVECEKVKRECDIKQKEEMSYSQVIREECRIIKNFFNNVFGEGTSEKIFGAKNNLEEHVNAFEDVVKEKIEQQKRLQATYDRYQPNRQERRYNQFKGKRK